VSGRDPAPALPLREALALGVLHGPAELLPISSSGHVALVPWLCGWSYPQLDAELRKSFEVALHAGTAAALLIGLRDEVAEAARCSSGRSSGISARRRRRPRGWRSALWRWRGRIASRSGACATR
jgi:undecaprenyl pyrophosphate phosphatase UppP